MTLHRSFGPALVALAALVGCGETTLEPIGDGGGGGGAGGNGAGASNSGGNGSGNGGTGAGLPGPTSGPESPVLMVVHADETLTMMSNLDQIELGMIANTNGFVESTYHVLGQYDDLVYATHSAPGTVDLTVQTHAINRDGVPLQDTYTVPLEPVGEVAQVAVDMQINFYSWMVSQPAAESPGPGPAGNRLYWTQGSFGPFMSFATYEATPPIGAWTILPNQRTVVASTAEGVIQINAIGIDGALEKFGGTVVDTVYTTMKVFGQSLYAVTDACAGDCVGELHIWRNLGGQLNGPELSGPPDEVLALPSGSSAAHSLSVGTRGAIIGTVGSGAQLFVYRGDPEALSAGATPDETLTLDDDAVEVESVHWGDDDDFGRRLSIYLRGTTPALRAYEDSTSGPLLPVGPFFNADDGALLDIHVAD